MANKLLVANRAEIASRIIRAARALDLPTVAVYSDVDQDLPYVREADERVALAGKRATETYLVAERLLEIARAHRVTHVHPGYGFLSENAAFARRCRDAGLIFVGPEPETIAAMGEKDRARRLAQAAGVPILPGSDRIQAADVDLSAVAEGIGFPLLVKACAGGGGVGMRLVHSQVELAKHVGATQELAGKYFGDSAVYLERYIERARHLEVQVFGFGDGTAVHLFERECSLQRRHQKIVEEGRPVGVPESVLSDMARAAVELAQQCRYSGAGTVEFVYDDIEQKYYFLEMNTRVQVEHPVTEAITGVDIVAAQLTLAMGGDPRVAQSLADVRATGHAVEVRLYAEDPTRNFMPAPGVLQRLTLPTGAGIRVDTGYHEGNVISPFYDPMIMKIIAHGASRSAAMTALDEALATMQIDGVRTNRDYLRQLLSHPEVVEGRCHTRLVESTLAQASSTPGDANRRNCA